VPLALKKFLFFGAEPTKKSPESHEAGGNRGIGGREAQSALVWFLLCFACQAATSAHSSIEGAAANVLSN
jgi:hypothetical protein